MVMSCQCTRGDLAFWQNNKSVKFALLLAVSLLRMAVGAPVRGGGK